MKPEKQIPWEGRITNIQGNVLEALARYKFLTTTQMLLLGVGTSQYKYLWKQVASLRDRKNKLVDRITFATESRLGRVEDFYFLTPKGVQVLAHDFHLVKEDIRLPLGSSIAYKDYHHRKATIDFHIQLNQWAGKRGVDVHFFLTYFDKAGNNRTSKNLTSLTKIDFGTGEFIVPDAVFKLCSEEKERLFLFEMHNGEDTLRLLKQLHKHAVALVKKFAHRRFGYDPMKSYTVLLLFEYHSTKEAFIKRILKEGLAFQKVQRYFLCKSMEELRKGNFCENWKTVFGHEACFFE